MDLQRCPDHQTPLNSTKISSKCNLCYKDGHNNKKGYKCDFCDFYVHEECINTNIPSRHKHPLKLKRNSPRCKCCLCGNKLVELLYQCSPCDFRKCLECAINPMIINRAMAHKHELQQVSMKLTFTCDACGLSTSNYPCVCHQCSFIIHRSCTSLPRIIYINRHDHQISHVFSLGLGKWNCGVCHETVNSEFGAYSCLICSYAVHSLCATRVDIWDGRELYGKLGEEEKEENKPFQVINQNLIKHFSHQHNLKVSLGLKEDEHCYACILPFNSEKCYRCTQCDFILHDACANLPLKKRHPIYRIKLSLCARVEPENYFFCQACRRYCNGFSYAAGFSRIDVNCASITDALKHESHPHLLFLFTSYDYGKRCTVCDSLSWMHLRCVNKDDCDGFTLCFTCATLPRLVRHKYDDHPLSLCYGKKNGISTYWCGICEKEINLKNWFYWCRDCDSTLHTECVFKYLLHPEPGYTLSIHDKGTFDLLRNDSLSRPTCCLCKTHCMGDLVLHNKADTSIFMCTSCGLGDIDSGTDALIAVIKKAFENSIQ